MQDAGGEAVVPDSIICLNVQKSPKKSVYEGEEASEEDALDNEFLMYRFKVVPCTRRHPHYWAACPCAHKGERASRRDLNTHPHAAIACIHAKQRHTCPRGDSCPHAHNLFEYWLHPQRYRTELCQFGSSCERPVCFFAHSFDELRLLDARLPPAETCWSAGAAVSANSRAQAASFQQQQQLVTGASAAAFAEAAPAAAAVQMQANVCFSSGLQQLHAAQMPPSSLGMASTASQGSMLLLLLLQHQQHQKQLMFTAGSSGQSLPLLASRPQQLQESPVQALLPTGLSAPHLWPGSCGSLAAAAAAPEHIADAACSSCSNISSSWSTSSMVDSCMSPAAAASSMPCLTGTMLAGSGPHSPASLLPRPMPATSGGTSIGIWAAGTPPAPQPRQQQQPAHLHTMASILSALQELQLRHHA